MCEERPCMAGVAVDRYGFVYDCFHHLPLGAQASQWQPCGSGVSTDPPRQGRCRVTLCSPAAHPPSNRSSSGGLTRVGWQWQMHQWWSTHCLSAHDGSTQRAQPQGNALLIVWLLVRTYTYAWVVWCILSITYIQTNCQAAQLGSDVTIHLLC